METPKSKPKVNIPNIKDVKMTKINFNLNTILTGVVILIAISLAFNFFKGSSDGKEISLNGFVSNIKQDNYAVVDIRDDGKAVAQGKYFIVAPKKSDVELVATKGVTLHTANDLEVLTADNVYELIRPLSLQETFNNITNPNALKRAKEIFVGDTYLIVTQVNKDAKNGVIYDYGKEAFNSMLTEKGLKLEQLPVKVHYLNYEASEKDTTEFVASYGSGRFSEVWQLNGTIVGEYNTADVNQDFIYWNTATNDLSNFTQFLQKEGISFDNDTVKINIVKTVQIPWGDILVTVFLGALIVIAIFMFRGIQSSGNGLMKFGQSKARMFFGRKPDVTFKDVAGIREAKEELREIVMFLKDPRRFLAVGARIPKGALMVGAPGTGKTLLARAIAGEAGVPFFHTSGSEFEEMLVGAGASRVRDLFDKAKRAAPALIFIDEIDAVARKRGTTIQSGTTEQTLNQILVEMDGFEKNTNVIVIAATNRPDVLDPAILRPGRFDRRIVLDLPDLEGRKEIIDIHAKNKPIAANVDLETIAKRTVGFSGADIENMLNEAAIIVAKNNRKEVTNEDLEEAATKVQIGPERKRKRSEKELKMTAYHEAGHALVMKLVPETDPVHRITIVSRGMALGYTMPLPDNDQLQMTKTQMLSKIKSLLAGYATEEMIFGDVTSGASNDIEKATSIAKKMVMQFGMSKKLGLVKYGDEEEPFLGYSYGQNKDYSEETAKIIDEEVRSIIDNCLVTTKKLLTENKAILEKIVNALLEKETLEGEDFNKLFEK